MRAMMLCLYAFLHASHDIAQPESAVFDIGMPYADFATVDAATLDFLHIHFKNII